MKAITVKELIEALKTQPQDSLVALSVDSEGNSYSLIANEQFISENVYIKNELGSLETYFEAKEVEGHDDKTVADFYGNPHKKSELKRAIILWPTN